MTTLPTQSIIDAVTLRSPQHAGRDHPALLHLRFQADLPADARLQLYINGELRNTPTRSARRNAWLLADRSIDYTIELLAVDQAAAWHASPSHLQSPPARVQLKLPRDVALPINTIIRITLDGEHLGDLPLFPPHVGCAGLGASLGDGALGLDSSFAPGLGAGDLGLGPLGTDQQALRLTVGPLSPGEHTLTRQPLDANEQPIAAPTALSISI